MGGTCTCISPTCIVSHCIVVINSLGCTQLQIVCICVCGVCVVCVCVCVCVRVCGPSMSSISTRLGLGNA